MVVTRLHFVSTIISQLNHVLQCSHHIVTGAATSAVALFMFIAS